MSQEITVKRIVAPLPLLSAWISSDSSLHVKGIPQLTWDKCSSLMIHCLLSGCISFAYLSNENRKGRVCICTLLMQMTVFRVSKCIPLSKKSEVILIWNGIVAICVHFNTTLPTAVRAEHWLWPNSDERPGLPRRDVSSSQAPSSRHGPVRVEAYSRAHHPQGPGQGGLQRHINISFHAAALNRNFDFPHIVAACLCLFESQLWTCQNLPLISSKHLIGQRNLSVPVHHSHRSKVFLVFNFLKLLRSPGKACPRFKALMTETFDSAPYQSFLRTHQVRQIAEEDHLFYCVSWLC